MTLSSPTKINRIKSLFQLSFIHKNIKSKFGLKSGDYWRKLTFQEYVLKQEITTTSSNEKRILNTVSEMDKIEKI